MQIAVECPHCLARFRLAPDMAGKSMRCPTCRDVFTATPTEESKPEPAPEAAPAPTPASPALTTAGTVSDFVPLVEAEAAGLPYERVESGLTPLAELIPADGPPPVKPTAAPTFDPPPARPVPAAGLIPAAAPIPTAAILPPAPSAKPVGPKEVVWSDGAAPPPAHPAAPLPARPAPPAPMARSRRASAVAEDDDYIRTHRPRRSWAKVILAGVAASILVTLGVTAFIWFQYTARTEARDAADAEQAYKDGNYTVAQQRYEGLVANYPESPDAARYRFFARLSEAQAAVGAVTTRENPDPARRTFDQFVAEFGTDRLADPEAGFGTDIVQAGKRLADAVADHAGDRLTAFREDRTRMGELEASEKAVQAGRDLLPVIDRFRGREGLPLDAQRRKLDDLAGGHAAERHRLAVLAPFRGIADNPSAEVIEKFQIALRESNLSDDAEAKAMIARAEERIRELVKQFRPNPTRPVPLPPAARSVLFAAPVAGSPRPRPAPDVPPDVVFAVARGVLYALDAHTGDLLWGVPVGPATADPAAADLPVRVSLAGGAADWVLIAGEWAGRPALTARVARTGEAVWYQPLAALPAARPVASGGRVYVPLRDPFGTVVEYEVASGDRTGEFTLRQPVAGGIAVMPGTVPGVSYLFVPGDSRRVFAFEVGREDDAGRRLEPRLVRVLLTEQPRDSLRGEPLLITPADETGPRFLILTQTDGPTTTKLRTFALPPPEELAAAANAAEEPAQRSTDVPVPGWTWFPSLTNGERVVLATDAGAFLAFGVNQAGSADQPLFSLPAPKPGKEQEDVSRSMVVAAGEDVYWAVLGGRLVRMRTAVDPIGGMRIVPEGPGRAIGEPLHRAQVRTGSDLGLVVVHPAGSPMVQAVAFDVRGGQVRWQVRLGAVAAAPPVVTVTSASVVADTDGGVFLVDPASAPPAAPAVIASALASPFPDLAEPAVVAGAADGRTAWVLAPVAEQSGRKLRVRVVEDGALKVDREVALPDRFAGPPVASGSAVLVPLANGYVYRLGTDAARLDAGPLWRGDAGGPDVKCFVTPVDDTEFLATDGGRRFLRWRWPAGADAKVEKTGGPWEARGPIALAPAVVPAAPTHRYVAADASGRLLLFDADQSAEPVRRWTGTESGDLPSGPPTGHLAVIGRDGSARVVYAVGQRHLVSLDPEQAGPAWVARDLLPAEAGEWAGWIATGDRLVVTSLTGRVVVLDAVTGKPLPEAVPPPGLVVARPAVPTAPAEALLLLHNGTGVFVPLPALAGPAR